MDLDIELLKKYYTDFKSKKGSYKKMKEYYDGQHDIILDYNKGNDRVNHKSIRNYVGKFVDDETSFVLGIPVNYISKSNNEQCIKDIEYYLSHWSKNHDINLATELGIYREAYELFYENKRKLPCGMILNPEECFIIKDEFNEISTLVREFKKPFDDKTYIDVYTRNYIYHFDDNFQQVLRAQKNLFGEVPVKNGNINKTIYDKIKDLQDDFNLCNSDQLNLENDLLFFYLVMYGIDPNDPKNRPFIENINRNSIICLSKEAKLDKIEKVINDTFMQNLRNNCKEDMYELVGHINMQQSPTSNTSGEQIINRMIQLKFRCNLIGAVIQDIVRERIRFLFKWLKIRHGKDYDYKDIDVKLTLNVPKDWITLANVVSQISPTGVLSKETLQALMPLDHSPQVEKAKLIKEKDEELQRELKYKKYLPDDYPEPKKDGEVHEQN